MQFQPSALSNPMGRDTTAVRPTDVVKWLPTVTADKRATIPIGSTIKQPYKDGSAPSVYRKIERDAWRIYSGPRFVGQILSVAQSADGYYPATAKQANFLDDAWLKGYRDLPAVDAPTTPQTYKPFTGTQKPVEFDDQLPEDSDDQLPEDISEEDAAALTEDEILAASAANLAEPETDNTKFYILAGVGVVGLAIVGHYFMSRRKKA